MKNQVHVNSQESFTAFRISEMAPFEIVGPSGDVIAVVRKYTRSMSRMDEASEIIDTVWSSYPGRKVRRKDAARALSKVDPMPAASVLLHYFDSMVKSGRWDEKKYIPSLRTIVANREWENHEESDEACDEETMGVLGL